MPNGKDLKGWQAHVPSSDKHPNQPVSFIASEGILVSLGEAKGRLITDQSYGNACLPVEYRFPEGGGDCGVLAHVSRMRVCGNPYTFRLNVENDEQQQFKLMEEIRGQVAKEDSMDAFASEMED